MRSHRCEKVAWMLEYWISRRTLLPFNQYSFSNLICSHMSFRSICSWWNLKYCFKFFHRHCFLHCNILSRCSKNFIVGCKFYSNSINIKTKTLCQIIHTKNISTNTFAFITKCHIISHLLLFHNFISTIFKPGFWISSKFICMLSLKNLSRELWHFNFIILLFDIFLKPIGFFIHIPAPFVNLLQFKTSFFWQFL